VAALLPRRVRPAVDGGSRALQTRHPSSMIAHFDIAVVGFGPSGSVAAWRLAGAGHTVALIGTADRSRRQRIETLASGVAEQLTHLGLDSVIGQIFRGTDTSFELRWRTNSFEQRAADRHAVLVDRAAFDASL